MLLLTIMMVLAEKARLVTMPMQKRILVVGRVI